MLQLELREEFRASRLKGTAIVLSNSKKDGATQIAADKFLEITYPSTDALKAIEAIGPGKNRPLVFIGGRGQGKSHLMAMLYHTLSTPQATKSWLDSWKKRWGSAKTNTALSLPLRPPMHIISESLHRQNFKNLWDLVLKRHPHGEVITKQWQGPDLDASPHIPSYQNLMDLFSHTPTALILDEFQTWYDGLTNTKHHPLRVWAFNFIQLLSEIAKERPDLLVLVVSVRHGSTDAYQQIHRVNPVRVDFKGPSAKEDRQSLLLHRLFINRMTISPQAIEKTLAPHVGEYLRLQGIPKQDHESITAEFTRGWPFAPHLMQLLEDQVLVATHAQETRDLIRILADLFKNNAGRPIITAASFNLNNKKSGITALLDSVSNQHHAQLREKAQRNLQAVRDATTNCETQVPHLTEIISSLWLRSLSPGNLAGAKREQLQIDITTSSPIDDNAFNVELNTIIESSFNIHVHGDHLLFRQSENIASMLRAHARHDKNFSGGTDKDRLAKELHYVLAHDEGVSRGHKVIILRQGYLQAPWDDLSEKDHHRSWSSSLNRQVLIVLPESVQENLSPVLGYWLRHHLTQRRNTARFLIPVHGHHNIFTSEELIMLARLIVLSYEWSVSSDDRQLKNQYKNLYKRYRDDLHDRFKTYFDRFAILDTWNYKQPEQSTFSIHRHRSEGAKIPPAISDYIASHLFIPEDFSDLVTAASQNHKSLADLIGELTEPRAGGEACIPWLGAHGVKDEIVRLCSKGLVALDLGGTSVLQARPGEDSRQAMARMKGQLRGGLEALEEVYVTPPGMDTDSSLGTCHQKTSGGGLSSSQSTSMVIDKDLSQAQIKDHLNAPTKAKPKPVIRSSNRETWPANLLGHAEGWNINEATALEQVTLSVSKMNGAQLRIFLKALPEDFRYSLTLTQEHHEQSAA